MTGDPDNADLPNALSDLAGLGKVGEALVSSVEKLVGGAFAPRQTRRIGHAQTDVDVDRVVRIAEAEEVAKAIRSGELDLRNRAGKRVVQREVRRQKNTENVLIKTISQFGSGVSTDAATPPEDDWIEAFWTYAENTSDAGLQDLWSQILASQILNRANSVSLATLDSLRLIEPHQAAAFEEMVLGWAAFGTLMDISIGDPPDPEFTIYTMENLALQGLGLAEIVHRQQNYVQGAGWAFLFHKRKYKNVVYQSTLEERAVTNTMSPRNSGRIEYHHWEFGQIRPSWRGLELCEVLIPGLTSAKPESPAQTNQFGRWSAPDIRAEIIQHWADMFSDDDCTVVLTRHTGSTPLDDTQGRRSVAHQTHWYDPGFGWNRFPDVADDVIQTYPPEIHTLLSTRAASG